MNAGYVHDGQKPLVLAVDREIARRQDAVAPLDVRLAQLQHRLSKREAAVVVVDDYASERSARATVQVEKRLQALGEVVHPRAHAVEEGLSMR